MAIMPISLSNCKNVEISDLEINGNVDKMTRDTLVAESFGFLIKITECENVSIVNVKLHHAQSDGIYVNGKMHPTINLKMSNVISSNNGRQGLSIINLNRGEFINCCFINTGFTEGKYGLHSPASGVDIESNLTKDSVRTGNLVFDNCTFKNNKGGQFFCTSPKTTRNVTVKNSTFDAVNSPAPYQIILNAENVVLDNCKIDCRIGNIWPTWKVAPGSKVRISNCEIKSSRNGILSASDNPRDSVVIDNNTFIFTGDASFKSYFLYLQTTNLQFTNNKIYMPAEFIQSKAATSLIQNARVSSGNKFYSGTNLIKSKASYRNTKIVKD
jgi:hypothetical protein